MTKQNAPDLRDRGARDTSIQGLSNLSISRASPSKLNPPAVLIYRGARLVEPERLSTPERRYIVASAGAFPDRRLFRWPWLYTQRDNKIFALYAPNWPRVTPRAAYRYCGYAPLAINESLTDKDIEIPI